MDAILAQAEVLLVGYPVPEWTASPFSTWSIAPVGTSPDRLLLRRG
jgi:hypothetical protein